jgi:hypothetical protein
MSIVYQHPAISSISNDKNDNKITNNNNNNNMNKKLKGPTILGMGSRSAFPPTMPNQVLCKQNQRAHMEWQRQQWMEEREQALSEKNNNNNKYNKRQTLKDKNTTLNNNNKNNKEEEEEEKTDEMEKEVDDLLDWIDGIEMDV